MHYRGLDLIDLERIHSIMKSPGGRPYWLRSARIWSATGVLY